MTPNAHNNRQGNGGAPPRRRIPGEGSSQDPYWPNGPEPEGHERRTSEVPYGYRDYEDSNRWDWYSETVRKIVLKEKVPETEDLMMPTNPVRILAGAIAHFDRQQKLLIEAYRELEGVTQELKDTRYELHQLKERMRAMEGFRYRATHELQGIQGSQTLFRREMLEQRLLIQEVGNQNQPPVPMEEDEEEEDPEEEEEEEEEDEEDEEQPGVINPDDDFQP